MTPILWSFRRCPYAMRARLALASAGQTVELREVVLRDKPSAFLATSPSATVPCLDGPDGVIDESLDIMLWALRRRDPEALLDMPTEGFDLVEICDGAFKSALDRYKYASRYEKADPETERARAGDFIIRLNDSLSGQAWLFGPGPTLADLAILPFVRQFAHVDLDWFAAQPWDDVQRWLDAFKASGRFRSIMTKYPPWPPGHVFPAPGPG
jgi:glutathione S-transferase